MQEIDTPAKPIEAREVFPSAPAGPATVPCNWNECLGGHRWPVSIVTTKCPGCGADTIAVKMENCPFCNEPASRRSLRVDHIPRGGGMNARCKGQPLCGPSVDVEFECNHWEVAQREVKSFEEKRADEKAKVTSR